MKTITFILEGEVPSKKNSRRVFARRGKVVNIPSERYEAWRDVSMLKIRNQQIPKLDPPYKIVLSFWMQNNRRTDLDNKQASILDLLQDCGIIEDDRWQVLPEIHSYAMGIDKECPRVKIEICSEIS